MKKTIILLITLCLLLCACGTKQERVVLDFSMDHIGSVDPGGLKLSHGDLVSLTQNGGHVTISAKVEPGLSTDSMIKLCFYSVGDLIRLNGFNTCEEITYYATTEHNGTDMKVIQFTLDKRAIDGIYSENILYTSIKDNAKDLWISPAIQ